MDYLCNEFGSKNDLAAMPWLLHTGASLTCLTRFCSLLRMNAFKLVLFIPVFLEKLVARTIVSPLEGWGNDSCWQHKASLS